MSVLTFQILIITALVLLTIVFGIIIYAFNSFPSEREEDENNEKNN